jgi:hypothetical protein
MTTVNGNLLATATVYEKVHAEALDGTVDTHLTVMNPRVETHADVELISAHGCVVRIGSCCASLTHVQFNQ